MPFCPRLTENQLSGISAIFITWQNVGVATSIFLKAIAEMKKNLKISVTRETNREKIIKGAMLCFEQIGPANTSMEDIANAAGLARKTVYRTFANRTELLDAVALQASFRAVDQVKRIVDACPSLDEAIVKGTISSVRLIRNDKIFMSIWKEANDRGFEQYFIEPTSPVRIPMMAIWKEAFSNARARGELRKDKSDEQISDWLRGIHFLFLLRDDLTAKGQEALLRAFVLPALYPKS
jgi:AcrR family transcriptional regulator